MHIVDADLDVDSDNNGEREEAEDSLEEDLPGKVVAVGGKPARSALQPVLKHTPLQTKGGTMVTPSKSAVFKVE